MSCDPRNLSEPIDFQLLFHSTRPFTKNCPYLYSDALHKIFTQLKQQCNIKFQLNFPPEALKQFQIRAHLAFTDPEHEEKPVERCAVCKSKDSSDFAHVLRYDSLDSPFQAVYEKHNGHCSVVVFPEEPASGNIIEANYKFMCLSSHKTIERKNTNLVFTLETRGEGRPVACQSVRVKVSCTPGRDAINEEKKTAREQATSVHRQPTLPTDMKTRVIKIVGPPAEVMSSIVQKLLHMYNSLESRSH